MPEKVGALSVSLHVQLTLQSRFERVPYEVRRNHDRQLISNLKPLFLHSVLAFFLTAEAKKTTPKTSPWFEKTSTLQVETPRRKAHWLFCRNKDTEEWNSNRECSPLIDWQVLSKHRHGERTRRRWQSLVIPVYQKKLIFLECVAKCSSQVLKGPRLLRWPQVHSPNL